MQQTRIAQGTKYYLNLLEKYPTVFDLAKAEEQEILYHWQGLGYYSRARNLHATAKVISEKYAGKFPHTYKELKNLKGIGDYTASIILSVCFDEAIPAVDGNVLRVIARIFGIEEAVNKTDGAKKIKTIVSDKISRTQPGDFNQALMDFGAMICTPKSPQCIQCPFVPECFALQHNAIDRLPLKIKNKPPEELFLYYFVFTDKQNRTAIKKRQKNIWKGLFEFPSVISPKKLNEKNLFSQFHKNYPDVPSFELSPIPPYQKHLLSHKKLHIAFLEISGTFTPTDNYILVNQQDLSRYPFPIVLKKYIEKKQGNLLFTDKQ